jgi:hypothetical protein
MKKIIQFSLMVIVFILMIIWINVTTNKKQTEFRKIEIGFFENMKLKLSGTICSVEEQTDTHKFLITLKNIKSNYPNYSEFGKNGINFCIIYNDISVFADHFGNYKIGDSIVIGENENDLIKCISVDGEIKLTKKRQEGMLYNLGIPNKRMIELVKKECK